jgi:hypothetical protein
MSSPISSPRYQGSSGFETPRGRGGSRGDDKVSRRRALGAIDVKFHRSSISVSPPPAPRPSPRPALLKAIEQHSPKKVREVLEQQEDCIRTLAFLHPTVEPPLFAAIRSGYNLEIIQLLIDHGASIQETNRHGQTPLMLLCELQAPAPPFKMDLFDVFNLSQGKAPSPTVRPINWCLSHPTIEVPNNFLLDMPELQLPDPLTMGLQSFPATGLDEEKSKTEEATRRFKAASLLLAAGAEDVEGLAANRAREAGRHRLARLIECYAAAQAYFAISPARRVSKVARAGTVSSLSENLLQSICSFLVPTRSEDVLLRLALEACKDV